MWNKLLMYLGICVLVFSCETSMKKSEDSAIEFNNKPQKLTLADDIVIEIYPSIELLAGVQLHTGWRTYFDEQENNEYTETLAEYLSEYRNSGAVKASQRLLEKGFAYDAPAAFALFLDEHMEEPEFGYESDIVERAHGKRNLNTLRKALIELGADSNFNGFFYSNRAYYNRLLERTAIGLEGRELVTWIKDFYGMDRSEVYHFVLAPAMFPSGAGYGVRKIDDPEKDSTHIYYVVLSGGYEGAASGEWLMIMALHEFSHSFVNSLVGDQWEYLGNPVLDSIFFNVEERMRKMAYPAPEYYYNELIIRAATVLGAVQLGLMDEADADERLQYEYDEGFYPVFRVYELLQDYSAYRDMYTEFEEYVPFLLDSLAKEAGDYI